MPLGPINPQINRPRNWPKLVDLRPCGSQVGSQVARISRALATFNPRNSLIESHIDSLTPSCRFLPSASRCTFPTTTGPLSRSSPKSFSSWGPRPRTAASRSSLSSTTALQTTGGWVSPVKCLEQTQVRQYGRSVVSLLCTNQLSAEAKWD